jgi:octaheme c-type cytochrome (tetrathionate reductase family)
MNQTLVDILPGPSRRILALCLLLLWGMGTTTRAVKPPPAPKSHVEHESFFQQPFKDGPAVTRACLRCHPKAAQEVMGTAHWKWVGDPVSLPGGRREAIGKKNLLNNFCIGIQGNWPRCTSCHAGYGWEDEHFDFNKAENVDCLVCHDHSGGYRKGLAGLPEKDVDLLVAARSVGRPTRQNCGSCHFNGGGGDAVKHGDLDQSLLHPETRIDIHMGGHGFDCVDCHAGSHHQLPGRVMSVSVDDQNHLFCLKCHAQGAHKDQRLNAHEDALACQTCHIPSMAVDEGTKMDWDWSTAGDAQKEKAVGDPHRYKAIKGTFIWEEAVKPTYAWYNGSSTHYLLGDRIDPTRVTSLAAPKGDIRDPQSRIWPFKVHSGKQIYDAKHKTLIVPKTYGPGGYWSDFDWDKAARLGCEKTGLSYSGSYGFAPTEMYWPLSHMVTEAAQALQCNDCHGKQGRMKWKALGYRGDPLTHGGRQGRSTRSRRSAR